MLPRRTTAFVLMNCRVYEGGEIGMVASPCGVDCPAGDCNSTLMSNRDDMVVADCGSMSTSTAARIQSTDRWTFWLMSAFVVPFFALGYVVFK